MSIYIILWIFLIAASIVETYSQHFRIGRIKISTREVCFWSIFIFCMLLGIMRHEYLGPDSLNYERYFQLYGNKDIWEIVIDFSKDNGYFLWNKIIYMLGIDYWGFKAISFAITFSIFAYVIYKDSKNVSISFLCYVGLFFLMQDFYIMRNTIAYSICFLAFKYLKKEEKLKFVLLVLLAMTFHKTAVFYLILPIVMSEKVKSLSISKKICLLLLSVLAGRFVIPVLYQFYRIDYSSTATSGEGETVLLIYLFMILGIGYFYRKAKDVSMRKEYDALFACLYIQISALFFSLMSRVTKYFSLMFTIVVPDFLMKRKKKGLYLAVIIVVFSVLYFSVLFDSHIIPYRTHWSG